MQKRDAEILRPLAEKIAEYAARPSEAAKKELWARHQALQPVAKIPITVNYEGIPQPQWDLMLGPAYLRCEDDFARDIEFTLRQRIWSAEHIGDDQIVWPALKVGAVVRQHFDWGVPLKWKDSGAELGAKSIVAPFAEKIDVSRVRFTDAKIDEEATRRRVEIVRELIGGKLTVLVTHPNLGHSPFEVAIEMCGIEGLMLYTMDCPDKVDALMDVVTSAYVAHHKRREREERLNVWPMDTGKYLMPNIWRVNCWYAQTGSKPTLSDEWAYVSAQSAAGLGPAMFERFAHVFNCRLAALYPKKTVYYHGCEKLDHKLDVLATLPHLRRFHVSPWSSVAAARDKFRGSVVLEVHAHPGKVFFTSTPDDMRRELRSLIDAAEGVPMDLNLSDINSVNGNPATLTTWARIAQEESVRR
jgi:hypothetical protein